MKYKTEIISFCFALAVSAIVFTACAFIEKSSNKFASKQYKSKYKELVINNKGEKIK